MKQSITLSKHAVERFKQWIGNEFSIYEMKQFIYRELIDWPISYSINDRDYYILPGVTYVMSQYRVITLYLNQST
ncbi:hypothetical protein [Exiguobacterium sp. ERU653]|uniref:hypothetical protein n=1 Tax=Exiguobacterium sp. ERU653 TaxID=2751254 RepID=UPI001BE59A40|nr:hypothetical protein [Exiguobacterium sp. ERU653]